MQSLRNAVREGRRREFAKFPEFADEKKQTKIPDPNAPETFMRCAPRFTENAMSAFYPNSCD